ncbi:MAG: hypothetical protein N2484_03810 [Clostridia bacterium]|nr:hypothetical protein [Clostridia bacterium]
MGIKENVNEFNMKMAERLAHSLKESLSNADGMENDDTVLRDFIYRMLTFYSSININNFYFDEKVDRIREKEMEIEFETFVTQPELWDSWKRMWEYQKPTHDKDWLNKVLKEEAAAFGKK